MKKWIEYAAIGLVLVFAVGQTVYLLRKSGSLKPEGTTSGSIPLSEPGSVSSLEVLPLYDDVAVDTNYLSGHGVSYLIRTPDFSLLMDLGWNPDKSAPSPLQVNMQTAGLAISDLDALVITHDHPDHVGGTNWWFKKSYSFGAVQEPLSDIKVYLPEEMTYPGTSPVVVSSPVQIAPGIVSIGTVEFTNPLPISFVRPNAKEQALAIKVDGYGVVLISGCGHPGLKSMLDRAETIYGEPVVAVIGGLHYLKSTQAELQTDLELLMQRNIKLIALSPHDSEQVVLNLFAAQFPETYQPLMVGEPIRIGE